MNTEQYIKKQDQIVFLEETKNRSRSLNLVNVCVLSCIVAVYTIRPAGIYLFMSHGRQHFFQHQK